MRYMLLLMVSIISLFGTSVIAQDATPMPGCTNEQWQEYFQGIQNVIDLAKTVTTEEEFRNALVVIGGAVELAQGNCGGKEWSSEEYPLGIIGPVLFGGEIYEATLESSKSASVSMLAIEGNCGAVFMSTSLDGGTEADLWRFKDCVGMIEVNSPDDANWVLTIKRIK